MAFLRTREEVGVKTSSWLLCGSSRDFFFCKQAKERKKMSEHRQFSTLEAQKIRLKGTTVPYKVTVTWKKM